MSDLLDKLNAQLARKSYLEGYKASKADFLMLWQLPRTVDAQLFPHIARWKAHIEILTPPAGVQRDDHTSVPSSSSAAAAADESAPVAEEEKAARVTDEKKDEEDPLAFLGDEDDDEETKDMMKSKSAKVKEVLDRQAAKAAQARSNLTLDIKPYDAETDMAEVERRVRELQIEGVKWLGSALMDVAFKIKMLRITAQLTDVLAGMDTVRDCITEALPDLVQSTDVFKYEIA